MPSQNKLIKQGLKYTDSLFDEITKRLEQGVLTSDTLEAFLEKTKEYTTANPLVTTGYDVNLLKLILQETNNHKFSRPAQKELVRVTIEEKVGELIRDVGEDIKDSVREVVKDGYNNQLSQDEIAVNISNRVSAIKGRRAKAIARTEIARAATVSDYVINKERGATHFYVECRNTACPICKEAWHDGWTPERDEYFTPNDSSAKGKGWIGDKVYSMADTAMLPPIHPNCRCVPYFYRDDERAKEIRSKIHTEPVTPTVTETTETVEEPTVETKTGSMFKGKPTVHMERDPTNGSKVTVYRYENGFELAISQNAEFTFEDIVAHIESLPEPLKNIDTLKRINIKDHLTKDVAGEYSDNGKFINLYQNNKGSKALDTLTHELAHALDASQKHNNNYHLSLVETYEKIFKADNKLYAYVNEITGKKRNVKKFPTDYAKRSYVKFKREFGKKAKLAKNGSIDVNQLINKTFIEDFAESTKLYLNPKTHSQFVKDFPNRAEYLESIYGKPVFDKNTPLGKLLADEERQQRQKEQAAKESEVRTERFNQLTKKQLDQELEKILGDKEKVKAYHEMVKEVEKLDSVQKAIMFHDDIPGRVKVLTEAGWSESTARNIAQNPNDYLSKVNAKKRKYKNILERTQQMVKDNLDLTQPVTETETEVEEPKTTSKPKTEEKPTEPKEETKPKEKNIDPVTRGKVKSIEYESYPHLGNGYTGPKVIEYEDGTKIKFKSVVTNPEAPDWTEHTLDSITIDGKTINYHSTKDVHKHFEYQDKQLTPEELRFADTFIQKYGTYAGQEFNSHQRGRLSEEDFKDIQDDEAFKWLMANKDKYNKILDKSVIKDDTVTIRIQAENYLPKGAKTIKDKGYTSSSAAVARTNLIDIFGNGRDIDKNWTFITVTPAGTRGARFQGNSIARNEGSIDDDFEMEITYKQNMEFDILLQDDKNKIIIVEPKRR